MSRLPRDARYHARRAALWAYIALTCSLLALALLALDWLVLS